MRLYKEGDVVKVWSLQSFFGGGLINGREGVVSQDQHPKSESVLVAVERKRDGKDVIDPSYEVYAQQLELVSPSPGGKCIAEFRKMRLKLKKELKTKG